MWPFDLFAPQPPTDVRTAFENAPLGTPGSVTGTDVLWTPEYHRILNEELNQALWNKQIGQGDYDYLLHTLQRSQGSPAAWRDQFQTALQSFRDEGTRAETDASRAAAKTAATTGLNEYERFTRPILQQEADRFNKIFAPGSSGLRSDAEFARFLSDAQGAINSEVNAVRLGASQANASRGVAQSGKVTDQVMKAGILGGESRGRIEQEAFGLARDGRRQANLDLSGFLGDLGERRTAVEAGNYEMGMGLLGKGNPFLGQNFGMGPATSIDLRALDIGNDRANIALVLQGLLGIGGMANNTLGTVMGALPGGG